MKTVLLGDVCDIQMGSTPSRSNPAFWDKEKASDNVWVSIADLKNTIGININDSKEYVSDVAASKMRLVPKGTLLVSFKLTLGRLAFAGRDLFTNEAIAALTIKGKNEIDQNYLYHYLYFIDWGALAIGDEKVKGKTLNKAKLKTIKVIYPESIEEQRRVVGELDAAFARIDKAKKNTEKNLQNAQELFDAELRKIFNENNWPEKYLSEMGSLGRGKSKHRPRNDPSLYGGDYPFVQTGDVRKAKHIVKTYTQTYNEKGLAQSKLWPKGTLCITIAANIAETGILDFDACFPDSVIGFIPKSGNAQFYEYLIGFYKDKLQAKSRGSAQDNINLGTFQEVLLPIPEPEKQNKIVNDLDKVFEKSQKLQENYQKKLDDLDELKQSLLKRAFQGKTDKVEV